MFHRSWLLALILVCGVDFAIPYEQVRAGFEIEDEDEAVHVDRRRGERPAADARRPQPPPPYVVAARAALRRFTARRPVTAVEHRIVPVVTQSSDPASPSEEH
jgi:hypothetical protein